MNVQSQEKSKKIETSLTLDYRKDTWGLDRLVLDGISNHLPGDTGGTSVSVLLKQGGEYIPLDKADSKKETTEVIFEDNGPGYDSGLLSVLFSSKKGKGLSVGQFGEGLKLIAAAALRNNVNLELRSRNWIAKPFAQVEKIDGYNLERLCFEVYENNPTIKGAKTVMYNPSDKLLGKVFDIPHQILAFNNSCQILSTGPSGMIDSIFDSKKYPSKIIKLAEKEKYLFVKGVRIQKLDSIFSYDLGSDKIVPDRAFISESFICDSIADLLEDCNSSEVIEKVLKTASEDPYGGYKEFDSLDLSTRKFYFRLGLSPHPWAKEFKKMFGNEAVISSEYSHKNKDAKLSGYNPITLNRDVGLYLASRGIKKVEDVLGKEEFVWVPQKELTENEKQILSTIPKIDKALLGEPSLVDVRIYKGIFTPAGREIVSTEGIYFPPTGFKGASIGIKRSVLQDPNNFVRTYIHELGHSITGEDDYERDFTDFFVSKLAGKLVKEIKNNP